MTKVYPLLLEEAVYADMVQFQYDAARWMDMRSVRAEAIQIGRSKKKLEELCRKGAILIDDTLTMKRTDENGVTIAFSATVGKESSYYRQELILAILLSQIKAFDQYSVPMMKTIGQTGENTWSCVGPNEFGEAMVRHHRNLKASSRKTWDTISVTRNNRDLGSLYLVRQCLELWENELEKWGCNGLGEDVGDKWLVYAHMPCSTTKFKEIS